MNRTQHRSPIILDGGMGRELRFRGVEILNAIWSPSAPFGAWLDAGATVIGGCCGTRPAHIKRIAELAEARYPAV